MGATDTTVPTLATLWATGIRAAGPETALAGLLGQKERPWRASSAGRNGRLNRPDYTLNRNSTVLRNRKVSAWERDAAVYVTRVPRCVPKDLPRRRGMARLAHGDCERRLHSTDCVRTVGS